jgi:C4-dicarboxylate-specific signal transduction histidine kinase
MGRVTGPGEGRWIIIRSLVRATSVDLIFENSATKLEPVQAEAIFSAFHGTKAPNLSLNLGLPLCKQAIEDLGGSLFVDTAAATTRFVLSLPRTEGPPRPPTRSRLRLHKRGS